MKLLQIHEPGETPLPHEDTAAVGIDLGTTNSVVAISTGENPQVIADAQGHALLPSAVYYQSNGQITVGAEALLKAAEGEANAHTSIKRQMGRSSEALPIQVSSEILKALKSRAEHALRS